MSRLGVNPLNLFYCVSSSPNPQCKCKSETSSQKQLLLLIIMVSGFITAVQHKTHIGSVSWYKHNLMARHNSYLNCIPPNMAYKIRCNEMLMRPHIERCICEGMVRVSNRHTEKHLIGQAQTITVTFNTSFKTFFGFALSMFDTRTAVYGISTTIYV